MIETEGWGRRSTPLIWGGLLLLYFLYFLAQPSARFEADDAYDYAALIERGEFADLLNPYHPIYLPIVKIVWVLWTSVFGAVEALLIFRVVGAVVAVAAVVLMYRVVTQIAGRGPAWFAAGGLAASYGFWRYASEAEIYGFAVMAAILLIWVAFNTDRLVLLAVVSIVAVLAHVLNAAAVLVIPLILRRRGWTWARVAMAGGLALATGLTATYVIYRVASGSELMYQASSSSFLEFYLGEGPTAAARPRDLVLGAAVIGTAIFASNFLMVISGTREKIANLFAGNALGDELAMGSSNPTWVGWLGAILALIAIALIASLVIIGLAGVRRARSDARFMLVVTVLWVLPYLAVVLRGGAGNLSQPEVWLPFLVPLWLFLGSAAGGIPDHLGLKGAPFVLAASAFVGGLLPLHLGDDRQEQLGDWLVSNLSKADFVVTADSAGLARYIGYYSATDAVHIGYDGSEEDSVETIRQLEDFLLSGADNAQIAELLASKQLLSGAHRTDGSGDLYFTADVFDPPRWMRHGRPGPADALLAMSETVRGEFEAITEDGWILRRVP